ncbi:MAG: M48 family metallopeptidase [Candidatus Omnitrophota bacterium]
MTDTPKAKHYHRLKNRMFFVQLGLNVLILVVLLASGLSLGLRNFSGRIFNHFLLANGLYIMIFGIAMYLLYFPLSMLEGYIWEHRFSLSNQKFLDWLKDDFKKAILSGFVSLLAIEVVYVLLRHYPQTWWIGASLFWLFLSLVLARLMPQVIIPLFYKYLDIDNEDLKRRVLELFEHCHLKIKNVYSINFSTKTKKANAFICGLGNNRRVVLTDNLLDNFTIDEIETVVAHEIGHYQHHDILKLTMVHSAVMFGSFFLIHLFLKNSLAWFELKTIDDIAFFPMIALALMVLGFCVTPFLNTFSRRCEVRADHFSVSLTKKPSALISAFEKLGQMNLAEFAPGKWVELFFYDHPPLAKRIADIQKLKIG